MENRIKVFIVDDHLMVRMGLGIMIDELQDLEKVGEAENGEATLRLLQKVTPDVILMDVRMPDINGMELSKTILAKYPEMKILLMTAFTEKEFILEALNAGVLGVIEKNISLEDLAIAIRLTSRGMSWISKPFLKILLEKPTTAEPVGQNEFTAREMEIARLLVKGLSNPQIADAMNLNINSVKKHLAIMYAKLGANSRAEAAVLLAKAGRQKDDE